MSDDDKKVTIEDIGNLEPILLEIAYSDCAIGADVNDHPCMVIVRIAEGLESQLVICRKLIDFDTDAILDDAEKIKDLEGDIELLKASNSKLISSLETLSVLTTRSPEWGDIIHKALTTNRGREC